jgi:glyoxylase-like metal-dependent hydrolase (beta-lactamase superfamily II)
MVLISHWHGDHTGGINDLLSIAPDAAIYKYDPQPEQLGIVDGQKFQVDGVSLVAVHTPGHTKDHMVFVMVEEDAMFTADNVLGHGTAVFEDLSEYLHSLGTMHQKFSGRAYPGHGPVIENGPDKITEYIVHRQQRMNQVLQTMREGSGTGSARVWSAMEIVKIIYSSVSVALHPAACNGVLQILETLARDGLVVQQGQNSWHLNQEKSTL